jgi:prepilin-type N-terminal cleavage/methylation domain-containing protein
MTANRLDRYERGGVKRAFTLLELLVVIAIIALLIAILLPALESARKQAKSVACIAHIKNIASSARVYESDDSNGYGIPIHHLQKEQERANPTFIGAYEWGGKSGVGRSGYGTGGIPYGSKYGTKAGFGPSTRPLNNILYPGGFAEARPGTQPTRIQQLADTKLNLDLFRCPGDNGPPAGSASGNPGTGVPEYGPDAWKGPHCSDWLGRSDVSSYDFFGNSYSANVFMIGTQGGGCFMSNSPYLRPVSRVPTPSRVLYYEENIGRWAWSCRREKDDCRWIGLGVDPGPTKAIRGWHGRDWTFNRAFVDSHAETQKIVIEGTEDDEGYFRHYTEEKLSFYPPFICYPDNLTDNSSQTMRETSYRCIIVRGQGWAKDTMPSDLLDTGLNWPGQGRPSYEDCVKTEE